MFFLTGLISHLLSFKMRLQNFDHLVEENLGYPVSFVVVQEWVEVQFARYILDFLSGKSGPNVYHQSQVYYKIVGRKKKISSSQINRISSISILLLTSHIIRYQYPLLDITVCQVKSVVCIPSVSSVSPPCGEWYNIQI